MTPRNEYDFVGGLSGLAPDEIIVDSFAGGGGASLGIQWATGRSPDIAINHDREAIALHRANHPESEHFAEDVWQVDPREATGGRRVGLMWLSPDCKHFSKAKGGKPVSKKIRGLAWVAVRWATAVRPRIIVLENVEEFQTWGPVLFATNKPDPKRKGQTFRAFIRKLERLGYRVEWKELRACDFGAPTIRKRLFLIARCDGQPITWPTPTHGKGTAQPWRPAAECIDWSLECPSIFARKKPLATNTLRRIARGIKRYVVDSANPFIVRVAHGERDANGKKRGQGEHDLAAPLGTVPASNEFAIVSPLIAGVGGRAGQSPERSPAAPYQTITAKADAALVAPFLIPTSHEGDARAHAIDEPTRTITGAHRGEHAIVSGFLKPRYGEDPDPRRNNGAGQAPRVRSLEDPMPVIVPTGNGGDLVATYLAKHNDGNEATGQRLDGPVHTVTSKDTKALVAAHLTKFYGTARAGSQLELPMPTVTASDRGGGHIAEVRAFLISYYGTPQNPVDLGAPTPTLRSRDSLGLVTIQGVEYAIADIGMRMLAPRELYRAQGFPDSYRIEIEYNGKPLTKTAQVRMCGNSVCPPQAAAIIRANVGASVNTVRAA
jgi:DNA (cytosine-5)-methyltransferase 1